MTSRRSIVVMAVALLGGCHNSSKQADLGQTPLPKNDLKDVAAELKTANYVLCYPAEAGIEPGDIWYVDGAGFRTLLHRRPKSVTFSTSPSQFKTLQTAVDVTKADRFPPRTPRKSGPRI